MDCSASFLSAWLVRCSEVYMVNTGCDLNGKNSDGCTPLVVAAKNDHFGVAEYLIEYGSNLDIESCDNEHVALCV